MMKKLLCILLMLPLILTAAFALAEEAEGDLLSRIQAKGEMVVATEGTWAPWTYHNEANELVGFDVEVARLVGEKLGLAVTFVECPWDSIFAGIDAQRYDTAANGVDITEDRALKYDFATPYGYNRTALIVRGDNADIASFEDLAGRKTVNSLGSTYMEIAESYGATVTGVDSLDETLQMVLIGRAEATLNAELSFNDFMKARPDANLKAVALSEDATCIAFPVRKGEDSATFLAALNQAIEELAAEGELSRLSMDYFGIDITQQPMK